MILSRELLFLWNKICFKNKIDLQTLQLEPAHCKEHGQGAMTVSGGSQGQNCLAWAWLLRPRLVKGKGEIKAKITSFKCLKKISEPSKK